MRYLLLAMLVLLLSGCSSLNPMNWFGDDDLSEPPAELLEVENQIRIRTLWSGSVGDGRDEQGGKLVPFVDLGRVYVADRNGLVKALNVETGQEIWRVKTGLEISGGPGVGEGLVLIGTGEAELVALNEDDGSEQWRARVSGEILSVPVAALGVAVVHTLDGKLFAFDITSGEQVWFYDRTVPVLSLYGGSSPVVSGVSVICGFASGKLVALDLISGEILWETTVTAPGGRTELERMVDIDGDPLVQDGVVYVTTYNGDMAAVGEGTGVVIWRRKLSAYTNIGADWRQLYVADENGVVWAIDPRNGSAVWKNDKLLGRRLSAPAALGEFVIVGDYQGYLHWLAQDDGRILARNRVGSDPISAAPVVVDDVAYIYGDGGRLAALSLNPAEGARDRVEWGGAASSDPLGISPNPWEVVLPESGVEIPSTLGGERP